MLAEVFRRVRRSPSVDASEERVALDALPDNLAIWRWSAASDELWATERFRTLMGLPASSVLSRDVVLQRIHPGDRDSFANLFVKRVGATVVDFEFRVITSTKETRWIAGRAHAWRESGGKLVRANGVIIDETDRRLADAEMERNRKRLAHLARVAIVSQLSATIAHELSQPLASILSNAQAAQRILAQEPVALNDVRAIVIDIVNQDTRATEIIRRLRDMLRPQTAHSQRVNIEQVAREVLLLARGELSAKHVRARVHVAHHLPLVSGDRVQIQQVLLNLLLNASEAMAEADPRDRLIDVIAESEPRVVHLQVIDRGSGIPDESLEEVFDPFFTTKDSGVGMGLAICRSIVSAHGGRLWATNNDGPGAAFHFTLPIAST